MPLPCVNSKMNIREAGECSKDRSPDQNNRMKGSIDDPLGKELWQLCAGRMFYVPKVGEKVFYFPQGHIEQVQAYTNQDGQPLNLLYDMPSKILCQVTRVQLEIEANTDEVFAKVTLLPVQSHDGTIWLGKTDQPESQMFRGSYFSKTLTPSDTSTHGGFSIPKRHADDCFPTMDMSVNTPTQTLCMKDMQGNKWKFRQIYRGQPKRHLLTTGWSGFVSAKKLVPGDTCIFIRGEDGELKVGIRRMMKNQMGISSVVISGENMQHGVLSNVFHAILSQEMFTVYCRPWTCPLTCIIPFSTYMKSLENEVIPGARFRMLFESEECVEQRFTGTVIEVTDIDPIRWPRSSWRRLKVMWEARTDITSQFDRVSPWNIELIECSKRKKDAQSPVPQKRARTPNASVPEASDSGKQVVNSVNNMSEPPSDYNEENDTDETLEVPGGIEPTTFKLFGIDLVRYTEELPSPSNSINVRSPTSELVNQRSPSYVPDLIPAVSKICIKVFKQGTATGRSVDLLRINNYEDLVLQIDAMFGFRGTLRDGTSGWHVSYVDNEGDMMLIGDEPWHDFIGLVHRLFVYPMEQQPTRTVSGPP